MAKVQAVDEQCPIELGLNILSGKWKLKILWHLSKGTIRFNELQQLLGSITTKTLTEQLRELEEQGIRDCKKSCVYRGNFFSDINQICKNLLSDSVIFMLSNFLYSHSITSSYVYIHLFSFFCIPIRH